MGFMDAVKSVYSNYFNFQGRARRSEYWFFYLFAVIVGVVAQILIVSTGEIGAGIFGLVYLVFILGTIIPQLAVAVRRLHDTDRSGWWLLIGLIPLVGFIVLLIFMVGDSKPGANKYGANPKGA
ncbi:DUF805 domain-containing protein [Maricaulaceae bacterium EIL42A08]|nr:DUF805 domain-containing protein [Maricaulaceae bacterium EIL42A08]